MLNLLLPPKYLNNLRLKDAQGEISTNLGFIAKNWKKLLSYKETFLFLVKQSVCLVFISKPWKVQGVINYTFVFCISALPVLI